MDSNTEAIDHPGDEFDSPPAPGRPVALTFAIILAWCLIAAVPLLIGAGIAFALLR